jgi:hypothetical protein
MSIKSCALSLFWLFLTVRSFITEDQSLGSFRMPKLALFMTVSENSLFIANASVIHQYDVRKGTIIRMYHDVRNLVAITASSRSILFGANSTTIFAWSTTNGTTIATLKSTKTVKSITSDQKENLLYITADVNIIQWRLGSEVSILPFQINNVTQLYLSDVYLIIHSSNEILVWNTQTKTGRKRRIVAGPNSIAIQKNSILVDEKINDEFVLCLYELKSMTRRPKNINYPIRRARLLAMAIMNDTIFLGTGDLSIHKMNLTSGAYLGELRGHRSAVVQLIAGQKLFSRGSRFQTKIWDPLTTSANATKPYDTSEKARFFVDTCQAIRFLYEKLFVLCSNRIQIFIPAFGTREQSSIISTGAKFTAISSDENFLYAGKSNGEILVYNGTTNHLVKSWRPFITKIIGLERYRDKLFVSSSSGTFAIDATTGAQIYQIHRSELNLLDMELREPYLFIATQEGIVIQHDISRNAEVRRWNSSLPLKLFCLTEDRILLDSGEEYNTTSGSLIAHWTIGKARYLACTSDYVFYGKNNSINQYRRSDKSLVNVLDGHAGPVVAAVGTSIGLISLGTLEAIIWEVPPKSQEKQIFDWINDEEDEEDDDDYRAADDGLLPANDGNAQLPATSIDTEPSIQVLEDYSDNIEFIEPGTLVETQSNLPFSTEWIPVSSQSFPVVEITQGKNSDTISDIKQSNKIFGLTMELFAIIGTFMAAVVFISIIVAIYVYLRWKKKKIKTESRMELFCRHDGINNTIDETSMTLTSTATASTMATLSKSLVDLSQPTLISEFSIPLNEFHGKTKWTRRDLALETDHGNSYKYVYFLINSYNHTRGCNIPVSFR